MLVLLELFRRGVDDGVCFCAITNAASLGVLASDVDGVDDGVNEFGLTEYCLVVHDP